ncbi:DNA repair protein RadC (plasmid) [Rhodobacter capsulatus]|uniref:DNA repair protein RadC n=1 Tax=Rhodobacter capsulatus TaxID=1061 RepID=UPI0011417A41|nr:DNA repair protein RadC [Rhodobacter capsulatus]TQD33336.1 DNA repair protein RadC [Rhodobacter capsulatus]
MLDQGFHARKATPKTRFDANAFPSHNPDLPFVLKLVAPDRGAAMAGLDRPVELDSYASLADAMFAAVVLAQEVGADVAPHMMVILDREERLVLAGELADGAIAWCNPVLSAPEARSVLREASGLRARASQAAGWREHGFVAHLRRRADQLEGRLVDPLWRVIAARALQFTA